MSDLLIVIPDTVIIPEFRDNSGINGNRKFSGLRYVNRKNFQLTEWKPEIFPVYEMETGNFTVSIP